MALVIAVSLGDAIANWWVSSAVQAVQL